MRTRLIIIGALVASGAIAGSVFALKSGTARTSAVRAAADPRVEASATLETKTVTAGGVEVKIKPVRIDSAGAEFEVTLTTHSGDLGLDLVRAAKLEVGGTSWQKATWAGDPPGGHHRSGIVRFAPGGPATGRVRLTIDGLAAPVTAEWQLGA